MHPVWQYHKRFSKRIILWKAWFLTRKLSTNIFIKIFFKFFHKEIRRWSFPWYMSKIYSKRITNVRRGSKHFNHPVHVNLKISDTDCSCNLLWSLSRIEIFQKISVSVKLHIKSNDNKFLNTSVKCIRSRKFIRHTQRERRGNN